MNAVIKKVALFLQPLIYKISEANNFYLDI
jgi:hypothetical protein